MATKKVLFIACYRGEGVEHFSRMLLDNLGPDFTPDVFLVANKPDGGVVTKLIDLGRTVVRLARKLRRTSYDVVHINPPFNLKAILRDSIYLWLTNRAGYADRTVVFFHGWDREFGEKLIAHRAYRGLFRHLYGRVASLFLFDQQSHDQLARLGVPAERIHVTTTMYQKIDGLDRRRDDGVERPLQIVLISRLVEGKGVEIAAEAAKLLVERGSRDFHMTIAGSGSALEPLRRFIAEHRLEDYLTAPGYVRGEAKADLLRRGDVTLLPTQLPEGCPITIVEALGAGHAIVSTPRGAIPNVVRHGENGLLCDSADPRVFCEAIESLMRDRPRLRAIQRHNREQAEQRYEAKEYGARMGAVYRSLVGHDAESSYEGIAARAA